ncbi:hypothetical protein PC123_g10778 [Phytophthora cactorum]|nr:hypothetical protein PC123_g10778 [Phytophthora cactorum]
MRFARLRGNPPAKSVLTDIRSRCKWLPELEKLCLRAVDRLEALHDEVAQCREDDPPRVKYIDTVVILLDRIIRRKPLLTRLARFHSVTLIIRGLHQDLDEVETGLGTSIEGNEWRDQWERDRTEQFSILEQLVQNTTDRQLVREIKSEKVVEQVLMELHKELVECPLETHWQLMRATFDRVCAFARLNGIQYPDWYISADDLMFEEGPGVAGTFGEVRRATWFHGGERTCVIVKQLFQDSSLESDQDTFEQFERWKNLSGCDHILTFHGGSHASKPQFFVCEYAPYGNLRGFLTDEKNETMMWPLFLQAAEGLKALHSHGIVHGALKCSNILVDANYTAKLADFGFASARMHAMELNSVAATAIGSAVRWKPKEILEYSDMTGPQFQADTYSLGMCMIEALTHQAPFSMVGDDTEAVEMILHGESHPRPDGVSDAVWNLISQLSEPDSAKRPTLDMAIEMIRELIKMQAKEKESDIMASIAGMTAIKSTEEAGTVPGEMVKTEVFCSWEADGSIVTTTVRTTTCTRTSASGELITEVTNTETEVTTETTETTEETVEEVTEETMEGTQGTITTTETTEVTEVTTIETITEEADAGSEDGMESSAALVASDTAAMSSLYARYAHESSSMESMTLSVDIDAAAQEIHRVCTGATSNEAALASLLLSKTVEQRYLIWCRYRILYKQNLSDLVKSKSDYGVLLKMLASPLEHAEAEILRKATKGLGTTEEWIYPVVMGRSNADIALLKKTFQEKYSDDLGKILNGDLSGSLKKVIETAMRGEVVEFDASVHTSAQSSADADRLYKAGEGRWGTDKKTFINILVLSPAQHVRNINRAYMVKHKSGLIGAIKAEFSGDTKRALLFLVRSVLEPMDLLAELFETALKRAGKNAYGLSAWVVRYFHLLERIFIAYRRLYRQDLRIRIRSVVRGEYRQLLLSVFDAAGVELGVFTPRSGLAGPTMSGAASRGSVMPMVSKTVLCSSCTVASDPSEGCCRCCGELMERPKDKVERNALARYLKTHPRGEAWRKMYEVAIALQDLHDQGIIHGNLKPSNLIVGRDGRGHLSELESCKRAEKLATCVVKPQKNEVRWQAPECLNGGNASFPSDVYSLGMCIIYAISGKPPWGSAKSDQLVKYAVCNQHGMPPRPQELSNNEWDLVKRMCDYDPSKRIIIGDAVQELSKFSPVELTHVPVWDLPRNQIVFSDETFSESAFVSRHLGRWKDAVVAVETIKQQVFGTPKRNFRSVADLWFSLKHPAILHLFRACDDGDDQFFVCEYAKQGDLNMYLHQNDASNENGAMRKRVWKILLDVALAIHYLHSIGIVHGDITSQNILVGQDDHGKLSGFMLSFKQSWDSPEEEPTADSEHSVPSCVNGHHVGFESDVYWLGQCIVDVFCGQSMTNNRVDTAMRCDGCNTNPLLHRPEELTDTEWQLIKDMCAAESSSRIDMPDVVERLARLIAVDAVIDQLASSSSQYLDCSKRNRGQSNLLTVMSSYTTTSGQSNLLMSCYATGYDTNSDLDYDSFSDSLELSQETVKGGVLEVKFEELTQVDSFDRSAEDAVKERYRDDLETLLNAEEKGSSSSNGLLMASAQPRKLYGRLRCLPPDPISPQWILSTDHIAESTWRESDLGSGSFAAVCRGAWLGAPVALKKLKKFDLKSAQTLREEANIWFTLRHPNIVSLFGASTRGYPLFVCEYIDGQRLDECRKGEAKVSDEEIWGYLHDAAVGLQGLHMHGVVHADLKCDNILIGAEGRAKLIDFGLSCLQTCDGGAPLGAKQWKAPECLQGAGPTFESDIYGFGMCIIQAFAGKCPWGQIPDQAVAVHVANGRLPSKPATLTQLQWEAIRKMCRQDPQARLQLDFVVRVLGFFAGHLPYIDDATLQEEFSSWTSTTE